MKLTAIDICDAFPKMAWAQLDCLKGYKTVIPAEGYAYTREYNRLRRDSIRRVLALVIEKEKDKKIIARLKRVNKSKIILPQKIRVRYNEVRTTYRTHGNDERFPQHVETIGPFDKLIEIQKLIDFGLRGALKLGAIGFGEGLEVANDDRLH